LFKIKQYIVHIHHIIMIPTIEVNCCGQPDNCYVIVNVAWVVPIVDDAVRWCKHHCPNFWCIMSISAQYDMVTVSPAAITY